MAIYNTLSWQNENGLSGYPFSIALDIPDVIVDASFVQYDAFVPVLNSLLVNNGIYGDVLVLSISFDRETQSNVLFLRSEYDKGPEYRCLHLYASSTSDAGRYLGTITFGSGCEELWTKYMGRNFSYNRAFLPDTVKSIPSQDAVYLFDGSYGDVVLSRQTADTSIFYNTSTTLNSITFNAVDGHSVDNRQPEGLRKINMVAPINNTVYLAANDTIKFTSNADSVTIDLSSGTTNQAFTVPTLTS